MDYVQVFEHKNVNNRAAYVYIGCFKGINSANRFLRGYVQNSIYSCCSFTYICIDCNRKPDDIINAKERRYVEVHKNGIIRVYHKCKCYVQGVDYE